MVLSEKKLYSLGRRCVYMFNRRKAKKEIPDKSAAADQRTLLISNSLTSRVARALAQ